jgi:hypothetical protein
MSCHEEVRAESDGIPAVRRGPSVVLPLVHYSDLMRVFVSVILRVHGNAHHQEAFKPIICNLQAQKCLMPHFGLNSSKKPHVAHLG